ncbi:MAG: hypothetical protein KC550_05855, partial [Nanoarchaeota archaeon]|nr:hypothetical protein [Nanoarchaeota archaeon]
YLSSCSAKVTNAAYQGHFGACHNGIAAYSLSSQFGDRNQYAETKLWGHGGGSEIYAERVFTRENTIYTQLKGIISMISGTNPFWTNISNPLNLSMLTGETITITWYVNATGANNLTTEFFSDVFVLNDINLRDISNSINITILNSTPITIANKTTPLNNSQINESFVTFNSTASNLIGIDNATLFVWNSSGSQIYSNTSLLSSITEINLSWNYSFLSSGNYTWGVLIYSNGVEKWADGNNFTLEINSNKEYRNYSVNISKKIFAISKNISKVIISLDNLGENLNISAIDFISSEFNYYNFSIPTTNISTVSGVKYTGDILIWNLSINSSSKINISYYLNGSNTNNYLLKNYIVGLS